METRVNEFGRSLFSRLSLLLTFILLVLAILVWLISQYTQQQYSEEYTQTLNQPVAMYIADKLPWVVDGIFDTDALSQLAASAMLLNPSLEIYLLDKNGRIMATAIEDSDTDLAHSSVDLAPIQAFLQPQARFPVYGDDPRHPDKQRVFSAYPIEDMGHSAQSCSPCGYVYAVIAGEQLASPWQALKQSESMQVATLLFATVIACALLSSFVLFFMLTRPLRNMTRAIGQWQLSMAGSNSPSQPLTAPTHRSCRNELHLLEQTCRDMAERLASQYKALDDADRRRRRFLTSISHDLRTPLTSVCGALETLITRQSKNTCAVDRGYLQLAYRQAGRLNQLIDKVFELARLDSGDIKLHLEPVAIQELAMDTVQELSPHAAKKAIKLTLIPIDTGKEYLVQADMAQINRVLVNLLSNALRNTESGGSIRLCLSDTDSKSVLVSIEDSGCGFRQILDQCPLSEVTDKLNHGQRNLACRASQRPTQVNRISEEGTGLGLGIVSGILALHGTQARVSSFPGEGSRVAFQLPLCSS